MFLFSVPVSAFKWNVGCQMEVLPPCGCKTTRLYVKITKEYLNPPACARIDTPLPSCSGHSDEFSDHYGHANRYGSAAGGATLPGASSAAVLILAAVLTTFVRLWMFRSELNLWTFSTRKSQIFCSPSFWIGYDFVFSFSFFFLVFDRSRRKNKFFWHHIMCFDLIIESVNTIDPCWE